MRDLIESLTLLNEGWNRNADGSFSTSFKGDTATLKKGKDKNWYVSFKGKTVKLPKKASFSHAEGVINSMM